MENEKTERKERTVIVKFQYFKAEKFPIEINKDSGLEAVPEDHPRTLEDMEHDLFNEIKGIDFEEFSRHIKMIWN